MKRKPFLLLILSAFILISVVSIYFLSTGQKEPRFRKILIQSKPFRLTVRASGIVSPMNRLEIKPPVAGRIESILTDEGRYVKKGQILAWMSSTERAALLDAARAQGSEELKKWEDLYKPTPVIAPLSGLVIANFINPGQTVTQQDPLIVLSDNLIVRAQVDETDLSKIRTKQSATIILDSFQDKLIPAVVRHIAYEALAENNVTVYQVEILPLKKSDVMRSGMSATIDFLVAEKESAILVPYEAVFQNSEGKDVVLISQKKENEKTQPEEIIITTGLYNDTEIEITQGLQDGDTILIPIKESSPSKNSSSSNPLAPGRKKK
jgi:multidrug efflux pump subunit AcrA (membrane-fusion protein)